MMKLVNIVTLGVAGENLTSSNLVTHKKKILSMNRNKIIKKNQKIFFVYNQKKSNYDDTSDLNRKVN